MHLTSVVVEPPRIAIRVGMRFDCVSSSFFKAWRFRKIFAGVTGNRMTFNISDCIALISDVNESHRPRQPLTEAWSVQQIAEHDVIFLLLER
jgi:hypothetical protein